jgi:hypothetical protein
MCSRKASTSSAPERIAVAALQSRKRASSVERRKDEAGSRAARGYRRGTATARAAMRDRIETARSKVERSALYARDPAEACAANRLDRNGHMFVICRMRESRTCVPARPETPAAKDGRPAAFLEEMLGGSGPEEASS